MTYLIPESGAAGCFRFCSSAASSSLIAACNFSSTMSERNKNNFFKKQEENNVSKQVVCQHSGFRINMAGLVSSKERGKQRAAKCWAVLPSLPCNGEADFPPSKETHAFNMFWGHMFLGSVFHLFCSHLHLLNGISGVGSCGSAGTGRETPRCATVGTAAGSKSACALN